MIYEDEYKDYDDEEDITICALDGEPCVSGKCNSCNITGTFIPIKLDMGDNQ